MNTKIRLILSAGAVAGLITVAVPAHAQFAKPEDAVKYRQSVMFLMNTHMGRINGQLKSDKPNMQVIQSSAALVETLSKLPAEAFVAGSDTVGNTKMKPEALKDPKVKELAEKLQAEVVKLNTAAKGGDAKAIQTAFGGTAQVCKACHDDYRK